MLNSIDILGILPQQAQTSTRPLVGAQMMRRQGQHQRTHQHPPWPRTIQGPNVHGPPPLRGAKYPKKKTLKENIVDSVRGFRLAEGLPTIGDIHDLSQNVTHDVKRKLGNIADRLR